MNHRQRKKIRCSWCIGDQTYQSYHDNEWGRVLDHDFQLFEALSLETFQSGLSWLTILKKRPEFRKAFLDFNFYKVSKFDLSRAEALLLNPRIIRHRQKISAVISNARIAINLVEEHGSLKSFFYPDNHKKDYIVSHALSHHQQKTAEAYSVALSEKLKTLGWSFIGSKTIFAFMQAVGIINSHSHDCYIYNDIKNQIAFQLE